MVMMMNGDDDDDDDDDDDPLYTPLHRDSHTYKVRGETYMKDKKKVK